MSTDDFQVLNFLRSIIKDSEAIHDTRFSYPTAISKTLDLSIIEVERQKAIVEIFAAPSLHGNQQGTIHGGLICELADAATGTAHSTIMLSNQTFTSLEIKVNFIRPVWKSKLRAEAFPIYSGKTITHYKREVKNEDNKLIANAVSIVMTLAEEKAISR